MKRKRALLQTLVLCILALFALLIASQSAFATVGVYPAGITFPSQPIGTTGPLQYITLYNVGTNTFTVNTATVNSSQFKIVSGTLPYTLAPNQYETFQVQFAPDSAGTFNGLLTFTFTGATTQNVNLTGYGTDANAIPVVSATSIDFGQQALGVNGPAKTLTITNNGTSAVKLTAVTITAPYTQKGFTTAITIGAGKSFNLQLTFVPFSVGAQPGIMMLTYDIAPSVGISLWGTATSNTALGITAFPNLPSGTQGSPYQATLTANGGTAPYSWSLNTGSSLPTGLTMSTSGIISGTIASSVPTGNHSFTVRLSDSSRPSLKSTGVLVLPVSKGIGANCNNISFNATDSSGPLVPINDLGTKLYAGAESGGLYANGSNVDDPTHDAYGQSLASGIQPLDSNGNPDPNGKYVLLGIGLSVTQQSLDQIVPLANLDPSKNPQLVVVNGGTGGATAGGLTSINNNPFWEAMTQDYLPNAGVTANQVVAVWFMDVDGGPSGSFPGDMTTLQSQLETIAQNLLVFFPNVKIAYASSIYYTGYSNGVANLDPEPYAYESGFTVKNMIQDQLAGNSNLNFDPTKGAVKAPWLAWGPYLWANGMLPRSDSMTWNCHDMQSDGTHPNSGARVKVAQQVLNFWKSDATAAPWFLSPSAKKYVQQQKK